MIGNLTIDKASMNLSYFLYTVYLIDEYGGRISRHDFVKEMAEFTGVPAQKNGKENRTPYNKSKLPRYFGFVDTEADDEEGNYLVLTNRGKALSPLIMEREDVDDAASKYCIKPENREDFVDLFFDSVIFDSFGKNNCGAEQSNTDVEPPKIVFKTLFVLGRATAEEICYIMYGMNRGVFKSFNEAIKKVEDNRASFMYDYSSIMEQWEITNIVSDCKIINIFTDENIGLLYSEKDPDNDKTYYYLSKNISETHKKQIETLDTIYQPLKILAYTDANDATVNAWLNETVLSRVSNEEFIFRYNVKNNQDQLISDTDTFSPGVFERALAKAFQFEKRNVYLILEHLLESQIKDLFGQYSALLKRINDLSDPKHGWSEQTIPNNDLYNYLVDYSKFAKQELQHGMIQLPSNLHIIGTVVMDNIEKNVDFDYEFKRCLVKAESGSEAETKQKKKDYDFVKRLETGCNVLLYGVPGAGKSWTIEHEYCRKGTEVERLVFHPDYTYSDFVGQILPNVAADGQVSYKFTPGPFTNILDAAYCNPMTRFVLVIEEINRGNAPAIFGEIFQLLDRKSEISDVDDDGFPIGTSEYGITNANIAQIVYGDPNHKVRIPSNLSIIGTMNTSDQNVFTLDTAFQRRWEMRLIENNFENVDHKFADAEIWDTGISWEVFCEQINNIIVSNNVRMSSSEDKRLGAYFVKLRDIVKTDDAVEFTKSEYDDLRRKETAKVISQEELKRLTDIRETMKKSRRFPEKVIKYLWDDAFKFNREVIFDTNEYRSLESVIRAFMYAEGIQRFKMFKQNIVDSLQNPESEEEE